MGTRLPGARKALRDRIAQIRGTHPAPKEPFMVSAVTGNGIENLVFEMHSQVLEYRAQARGGKETAVRLPDSEDIRS